MRGFRVPKMDPLDGSWEYPKMGLGNARLGGPHDGVLGIPEDESWECPIGCRGGTRYVEGGFKNLTENWPSETPTNRGPLIPLLGG